MNRSLVLMCAFGLSMFTTNQARSAEAGFTYTSQVRAVGVNSNYFCEPELSESIGLTAPDFGPFIETVTLTSFPGDSASQNSTLSSHAIAVVGSAVATEYAGCAGTASASSGSGFSVTLNVAEPVWAELHLALEFEGEGYASEGSYYKVHGPSLDFEAGWYDIVFGGAPSSIDWIGILAPGDYTVEIGAVASADGAYGFGGWTSSTLTLETTGPGGSADFDGDGIVDGADLGFLLGAWGAPDADLNGDGTTDGADLGILLSLWTR